MVQQSFRLARFRDIEIGIHYSWFVIFLLITLSLARLFADDYPYWTPEAVYGTALVAAVLFFGSIVPHELAHSLVALAKGIPVRSITLFVFGGLARVSREPDRPRTEFQIAIVGPLMSLAIAWLWAFVAHAEALERFEHLQALADWLAHVNLALALFNLLPGFPLDGGRVLRAAAWWLTGSLARATKVAAAVGQFFGLALIVLGIGIAFAAEWFSGLWLALIGWFLHQAARESVVQVSLRSLLGGLLAKDIMAADFPTVPADLSVERFVDDHILRTGQRSFLVTAGAERVGLITLHQVKAVPREEWPRTSVRAAMTPMTRLRVVGPETPALDVLEVLDRADVNQVPVARQGHVLGLVTRDRIIRMLLTQMELGQTPRSEEPKPDSAAACVTG